MGEVPLLHVSQSGKRTILRLAYLHAIHFMAVCGANSVTFPIRFGFPRHSESPLVHGWRAFVFWESPFSECGV